MEYGTKYCHSSPTLDEEVLHRSILAAVNSAMSSKSALIRQLTGTMELELAPIPGERMSLADIECRLDELSSMTMEIVRKTTDEDDSAAYTAQLKDILDETTALKEKRAYLQEQRQNNAQANQRIKTAIEVMEQIPAEITGWDESLIRQLVDTVKVLSAEKILVILRDGIQIEQDMIQ